jgi:23S rRNA (adenine1618-N6)-methyltransferase
MQSPARKSSMHERNIHRDGYDMAALSAAFPLLGEHVITSQVGTPTINFADRRAVLALNQAILAHHYDIKGWNLPEEYLCPPVPGRADYIHHAADLLAASNRGAIPEGISTRVLDIGVGANMIYPIVGRKTYGWSFTGSDIDERALQSAREIIAHNELLQEHVSLKLQKNPTHFFKGIVGNEDEFDLVVCNPPFYANEAEASEAAGRKWKNLGKEKDMGSQRNFGGHTTELYCEGGEMQFIRKMIEESFFFARKCYWFTTLVSKQEHMHQLHRVLQRVKATEVKVIPMSQGQKSSRVLAWTLLHPEQQREWRARRFWE